MAPSAGGLPSAPRQPLAIDAAPLNLQANLRLQQGLQTMAVAGKSYGLVYQANQLVGVFTYGNAAQAAGRGADFARVTVADWMTPLTALSPTSGLNVEGGGGAFEVSAPLHLPVVNSTGHWLGLLTPVGVYTLPSQSQPSESQSRLHCAANLSGCEQSVALARQHQDRLALALKAAQMGVLDWELATNTLTLSVEQQRLLGFGPGEFDGHYQTLFKHIHPEDRDFVDQAFQQAIRHHQRYGVDFRVIQPDGSERWLLSQGQVFGDRPQAARLAGVTLDISAQKRAEAELKLQAQRERLVGKIAQRIRTLLDLDSILEQTVVSVREFIEADRVIILQCTADTSGQVIQESCAPGYPPMLGWAVRDPWTVDDKFLTHYRQGRGLAVANIHDQGLSTNQLMFLEYFHIQAEVVVPLLQEHNLWGLLIAHQCSAPREWQTADVRLLQNLSTQVGIAIQQARLHQQLTLANQGLRRMAYLDGLTQVANRRRFEQHLDSEWRRMARQQAPLSIILADIDYFKGFNDLYGHQAGDNCLRLVARSLSRAAKRPGDLVARYGGEEFVIILPNTDLKGAETVAEEIRRFVRDRRISHKGSAIDTIVTMSLGVATCIPTAETTSAGLLKCADEALYAAKHGGRDQVRLAEDCAMVIRPETEESDP